MKYVLKIDACNIGLGAVLMQYDKDYILRPIEWASKKLTDTEKDMVFMKKRCMLLLGALKDLNIN